MGSEAFYSEMQAWLTGSPVLAALTLSVLAGVLLTSHGAMMYLDVTLG